MKAYKVTFGHHSGSGGMFMNAQVIVEAETYDQAYSRAMGIKSPREAIIDVYEITSPVYVNGSFPQ